MPKSRIEFDRPLIRFYEGVKLLAEQSLDSLETAYTVSAFNPEVAPVDNVTYNILVFRDELWVVPDEGASRFIPNDWAQHLSERGGFFYAEGGEIPWTWRRSFLLVARHPYYPKATVVPKTDLPLMQVSERIDPLHLGEYNQQRFAQLLKG